MRKNHAAQHDCNEMERYALLCSLLLFYWQLLKRIMLKGNPGLDGNKPGQTSLSSFWMSDKIVTPLPAEMPGQHIWELYRQQQNEQLKRQSQRKWKLWWTCHSSLYHSDYRLPISCHCLKIQSLRFFLVGSMIIKSYNLQQQQQQQITTYRGWELLSLLKLTVNNCSKLSENASIKLKSKSYHKNCKNIWERERERSEWNTCRFLK